MRSSTKTVVCLGLIGGTLLSITPAVRAQVEVVGGELSGTAGFFMPGDNNIKLLDIVPKELTIESSIGNTSTAVFTPTAARFTSTDNVVGSGDTGVLQGLLTGIAYDADAYPVLFSGVETQLDFAVNSFEAAVSIDGTLISPKEAGAAPLIFINKDVTLTDASKKDFNAKLGTLDVGELDALLDGGFIALPDTYEFGEGGGGSAPLPSIERRIKFMFAGKDIKPETLTMTDEELQFAGEANQKFQIQTIGTPATAEFKIQAPTGAVDITLGGPFSKVKGDFNDLDPNEALDYEIKGQAEGSFTAFLANDQAVAQFDGDATKDVQFRFEQDGDRFEGRSDGSVSFLAAAGVSSLDDVDFDALSFEPIDDPATCSASCSDDTPELTAANIRFVTIEDVLNEDGTDPEDDVEANDDVSEDEVEAVENELEDDEEFADVENIEINVFLVGLDRYYVVYPGKSYGKGKGNAFGREKIRCFKQVGPGSSIFPGLITLVPVETDDIPTQIIVGLSEIADADLDDETADDTTDETEDTSDDAADEADDTADDDAEGTSEDSEDDTDDSEDGTTSDETLIIEGLPEIP